MIRSLVPATLELAGQASKVGGNNEFKRGWGILTLTLDTELCDGRGVI